MKIDTNKNLLLTFLIAFLFFIVLIAKAPVRNIMEVRNFRAAEEILEKDSWLFPTLNDIPRVVKPPLPTWTSALFAKIYGDTRNVFVLRLPNLFVGLLLVWFVFMMAKDISGRKSAFFSIWILITSFPLIGEIFVSRWDLFATAFGMGSLWSLCRVFQRKKVGYFFLSLVFFVASCMSKGPILLLLYVPFFLALGIARRNKTQEDSSFLSWDFFPTGLKQWAVFSLLMILGIIIGHSWWFASQIYYPGTWNTVSSDIKSLPVKHSEPFYYYFIQLPALMAPWSLICLLALAFLARWAYCHFWNKKYIDSFMPGNKALLFSFLWFCIGLFLLSCFGAKKNRYFFPLAPSCCIFLGIFCDFLFSNQSIFQKDRFLRYALILQAWLNRIFLCILPISVFIMVGYGTSWYFIFPAILFSIAGFAWKLKEYELTKILVYFCLTIVSSTIFFFSALDSTEAFKDAYDGAYKIKEITRDFPLYVFKKLDDELLWVMGRNYIYLWDISILKPAIGTFILSEEKKEDALLSLLKEKRISVQKVYFFLEYSKKEKIVWNLFVIENIIEDTSKSQ